MSKDEQHNFSIHMIEMNIAMNAFNPGTTDAIKHFLMLSQAISLKRIADALDTLNKERGVEFVTTYGG